MNFMNHEGIQLVKKALQYLDRTQIICIKCSSKVAPEIRAILAAPAPLLRSFHLFLHGDEFEVDEGIFDGAMPNLQNVGLSLCTVDWSSPIFNGLTKLAFFGINHGTRGIVHGLILTLGRLLGLHRLESKVLFWKRRDVFTAGNIQNVDKVALSLIQHFGLPSCWPILNYRNPQPSI